MNYQFIKQLSSFLAKTILCTALLFSTSLQAEGKSASGSQSQKKQYYIVEVILFRHNNTQGKNNEYWDDLGITDNDNSSRYALAEYNLNSKHFSPIGGASVLSPKYYKLLDSANHIRYSKDFELLAHFGWTQRSFSRQKALPVLISANQFSDELLPNGDLTLYVSRFLHLKVNLVASDCVYEKNAAISTDSDEIMARQLAESKTQLNTTEFSESSSSECVNKTYLFSQNRKMRSKELHYIDNPVFGLLVYVTPFKRGNG